MMKALAETIIPAIHGTNRAAVEQAHIVLGSLERLRQQIDYAHWFEVRDARGMARLIRHPRPIRRAEAAVSPFATVVRSPATG